MDEGRHYVEIPAINFADVITDLNLATTRQLEALITFTTGSVSDVVRAIIRRPAETVSSNRDPGVPDWSEGPRFIHDDGVGERTLEQAKALISLMKSQPTSIPEHLKRAIDVDEDELVRIARDISNRRLARAVTLLLETFSVEDLGDQLVMPPSDVETLRDQPAQLSDDIAEVINLRASGQLGGNAMLILVRGRLELDDVPTSGGLTPREVLFLQETAGLLSEHERGLLVVPARPDFSS